jgi:hypothetical protein
MGKRNGENCYEDAQVQEMNTIDEDRDLEEED